MPAAGYPAARDTMWWGMYPGHNCTNYAAYRMVKSGLPNIRPWSGGGNATYWGTSVAEITDSAPAVGAIAWWKAGVSPAGSSGHLAYVERVVSPDEIIVSQDSWGGDFSWARITREGKGWPSGFIHFNDVPIRNVAMPAIGGTAKVGETLTVGPGSWNPVDPTISYQWRANGRRILDATTASLALTPDLEGDTLSVRVMASKLGYPTTSVVTPSTAAVQPGEIRNTVAPTITGEPRVDSALVADLGKWTPTPETLRLQWLADGQPIAGATTAVLPVGPDLVGTSLTVSVTAGKVGYTQVTAVSPSAARVQPGAFTVTAPPTVVGQPNLGATLHIVGPVVAPSARNEVQWLRNGVPVPGATNMSYVLTAADLGSRIAVRSTLTRPGYTTALVRSLPTHRIRTTPKLLVKAQSLANQVEVRITAVADGVEQVRGQVNVRWRGQLLRQVRLRQGTATVRLRGLPPGQRTIRIVYPQTGTVMRAAVTRTIRFR